MRQGDGVNEERRAEPRQPAAFAFWFEPSGGEQRRSAWMLNVSAGGASFLASADESPAIGDRLQLAEMFSPNRMVREAHTPLPRFARVLRVDDGDGATQRVAVRYEIGSDSRTCTPRSRQFLAVRSSRTEGNVPPPALASGGLMPAVAVPAGARA